ncbi:hypothetical protein BC628DRAFT_1523820 [Trametes gibbosa]|nr:hypothetical protein BC628DRAFT_1523820 [Trametes gibbosa]
MSSSQTANPTSDNAASHSGNARKRQRVEESPKPGDRQAIAVSQPADLTSDSSQGAANDVDIPNQPPNDIPVAMKVINAINLVNECFDPIGDCPTEFRAHVQDMMRYGPRSLTFDQADGDSEHRKNNRKDAARVRRNEKRFARLFRIAKDIAKNYAKGFLDESFNLRITRPGCEFEGPIARNKLEEGLDRTEEGKALQQAKNARLQQWYDCASVSGYGDVQTQVTKIDKDVRAAREIPASEFTVDDALLRRVERLWAERFLPSPVVRAEPYKIHLYGPGDHFRSHRDTPQKDLVGTFLVGLGDSVSSGSLVVHGEKMPAHAGSWCAFYPDEPHQVTKVKGGHRAVIAFKLFRVPSTSGEAARADCETDKTAEIRARVGRIVSGMEGTYGVLLQHKYSLNTDRFNGFDAILVEAVQAETAQRRGSMSMYYLPVVVTSYSLWGSSDSSDPYQDYEMSCTTSVYAFSSGHIDALTNSVVKPSRYGDGQITHTECGCPWLEGLQNVPFHSADLSDSTLFPYKQEVDETCNYVGNEAQAWRDDSVYLSFALVVLHSATEGEETDGTERSAWTEGSE